MKIKKSVLNQIIKEEVLRVKKLNLLKEERKNILKKLNEVKTYKKVTEEPVLKIYHDDDAQSPRTWSNLGYFITVDSKYESPDKNPELKSIVQEASEDANNVDEHMENIKTMVKEQMGEEVLAIYPVVKYEHGGVSYSLGQQHGFDYSNNGFYIVTDESQKEIGVSPERFEDVIEGELEDYNKWVNGELYRFELYDENGNIKDSIGGFYTIEDMKNDLPEEFKNEDIEEYLVD